MTMQTDRDLTALLARAKAGDQGAWDELFQTCFDKIRRVVRRKLDRPMRSLYDSADFASDVMKSLAANLDHLDFPSVEKLQSFLAKVAEQKVIDEYRRRHTLKRDVGRERALVAADGADLGAGALASSDPTPSQFAQADDVRQRLLAGQDEIGREAFELKRQGYSNSEIAERTGWNIRKVQRYFKDLEESLNERGDHP